MRQNLSSLKWTLTGYIPFEWQLGHCSEVGVGSKADLAAIPAAVPGSVQKALLDAGEIPDWNIGLNAKQVEWVENRHWLYETQLPCGWFAAGKRYRLRCSGLDHAGGIYLNGKCVYEFSNCHSEHCVEITLVSGEDNMLQILFECPPRWLGQFYCSSKIRDWKPRFYYTWDWISRLVQIGIWDDIFVEEVSDSAFDNLRVQTDYDADNRRGGISVSGRVGDCRDGGVEIRLYHQDELEFSKSLTSGEFELNGFHAANLSVLPWQPNNLGSQQLYSLELRLVDKDGQIRDECKRTIGFKRVQWRDCLNSPAQADPWLCSINGRDVFLQGVNWTPIRPNFADVGADEYRKRLELYKSIGFNVLRVWGGYTREKSCFYELCDELGLLVWQDMPLSSSGIENYPPDDDEMVEQYLEVVRSYVSRLHHHVSILLWCGGNELTDRQGVPLGFEHPMFGGARNLIGDKDPGRRFVPTTPSGTSFMAWQADFGKGRHWDVHGPWKVDADLDGKWESYWDNDDALFRSEVGAPGPSSAELIERYAGSCDTMPELSNPLWRRTGWWLEDAQYVKENGSKPETLADYVRWGQDRQARILCKAVGSCKKRFPQCGGIIIWMGHDCFPCEANTSIIDFEGNPKPAAVMLSEILSR